MRRFFRFAVGERVDSGRARMGDMNTITLPSGAIAVAPPHGLDAVRATFGPIVVKDEQIIAPKGWEAVNMVTVSDLPGWPGRLHCNRAIVSPLREALRLCVARLDGYVVHSLGCFAPRASRSSAARLSMHSWGIAVDINADTNRRGVGLPHDIPDEWVAIFEGLGWTWGGRFKTPDPMHFQWCSGA